MAITKTNFLNYTRCPRYVALEEIRKEKLCAAVSYEDYKKEELEEQKKEMLATLYEDEEFLQDATKVINPQMEAMLPYYKQVEVEAGKIVEKYFPGKNVYAEKTKDQECFECIINNIKYLCYVDIYNENGENINIIEVKATTTKKYIEMKCKKKGGDKYSIWHKENNIYRLKNEIEGYDLLSEMEYKDFEKKKMKLFERYSDVGTYVFDLAVQRFIIENEYKQSGNEKALENIKYYLAVLNSEYIYDGNGEYKEIDGQELISFFDLTRVTKEYQERVDIYRKNLEYYLEKTEAKPCKLGEYCGRKKTNQCIYFNPTCGQIIPKYNSVFNYLNCHSFKDDYGETKSCMELVNEGYLHMLDIPESWIKSKKHEIQRNAVTFDKTYINEAKIKASLNTLKYPIYHLDFETFPCPLPRFFGESPYSQSPFEFSLHIENEPGKCDFDEDNFVFLAKTFGDERRKLVEALIEKIDANKGMMLAQNVAFEKTCIKNLAKIFPEYKDKLLKINENAFDLLWIINTNKQLYESLGFNEEESATPNYYAKELSGSFSIKKTLPVFSDLSYAELDVKNGMEAIAAYAMYPKMSKEEYNLKYEALITYCKQDTWAMVLILDALRKLVNNV